MKIVAPAAVVAFVLILANYCDSGTSSRAASTSSRQVAVQQDQARKDQAAQKKAAQKKAAEKRAAQRKAAAEKKAAAERKAEQERRQADERRRAEEDARRKADENAAAGNPQGEAKPEERPVARPVDPAPQPRVEAARRLPAGQCPSSVAFGQVGGDVLMLQAALVARGFPTENDGRFGSETRQSVKNIQARRSLPQTGKVDDRVWQALGRC